MKSPYTLLQEELAGDPWKIFVCCIFCNLTKRRSSEPYFWEVLRRWPTPEKLSNADSNELSSLIEPLGLSQRRAKALRKMTPPAYTGLENMRMMHTVFFVWVSGKKLNQKTVH